MINRTSFIGSHNRSKVKTWLYLAELADSGNKEGATINQIHSATGVPILTLRKAMDKWWSWQRLSKKVLATPLQDGSTCLYRITAFGRQYLEVVPNDFYNSCVAEIVSWQEERKAEF